MTQKAVYLTNTQLEVSHKEFEFSMLELLINVLFKNARTT